MDSPRELASAGLKLTYRSKGQVIKTSTLTADALKPITRRPPAVTKNLDGKPLATPIQRPMAVRIRCAAPIASAIDTLDVELDVIEGRKTIGIKQSFAVESYVQQTALVFPFVGPGIVTQAGVTNGGHANRSGQFALDVVGLNEAYAIYGAPDKGKSADYAGWGRTIIAPAAGEVVASRADRPDQPDPEKSDPAFHVPEFPSGGDPGNHLVISHGHGEFSMMAHFQCGSMLVRTGDRVAQGQPLGKLGSSGDTVTPHVHYQLQAGPDWQFADGLPMTFANVHARPLVRGAYFNSK